MQEVCKFICDYWKIILSGCFLIVSFIVALLRKKPVNDILTYIYDMSIKAVVSVEESGITGSSNKLSAAIKIVSDMVKLKYPDLDVGIYQFVITDIIENILTTPQKKGE